MNKSIQSLKVRYVFFIISIIASIITSQIVVQYNLKRQNDNASLINKAGWQRMLSQRITSYLLYLNEEGDDYEASALDSLNLYINQWKYARIELQQINSKKNWTNFEILFSAEEPYFSAIFNAANEAVHHPSARIFQEAEKVAISNNTQYLYRTNLIVNEYLQQIEKENEDLRQTEIILASLIVIILLGEFFFIILPIQRELKNKNNKIIAAQNDLLLHNEQNKIFIREAPLAIAMFDKNMHYLAASDKWLKDYQLEGQDIIGKSHYEIFPEIGDEWKAIHRRCMEGNIDKSDEEAFERADGTTQWLSWDVRPWYISEKIIGGIIMSTSDITLQKKRERKRKDLEEILIKSNEVAKIGVWEIYRKSSLIRLSSVTQNIFEEQASDTIDIEVFIRKCKNETYSNLLRKAIQKCISHNTSFDLELEIKLENTDAWIRIIGQAELNTGKKGRIFGIIQDITSFKKTTFALDTANKQLQAIFNSGMVSIIGTDTTGTINFFNHGAEVLLGYKASEVLGKTTPSIIHKKDEIETRGSELSAALGYEVKGFEAFVAIAKLKTFESREWTYIRKDGSSFPVQLVVTVIRNNNDEIIGYLGVATDISEQVSIRQQLEDAYSDLQILAQQLSNQNVQLADFAHIVSHNLRAPVGNLTSLMALYKAPGMSEEDRINILQRLDIVTDHLAATLNNLVEMLKLKGDHNQAKEEIAFEKVYQKTIELLSNENEHISFTADFSKAPTIEYNSVYMESIFLNLISNAIKYKATNRPAEIYIHTDLDEDGQITLSVKDNGMGIDLKKYGNKIFGLNKTFHHNKDAKGVGLFITKNQVESMGGNISVESEPDVGTEFTIRF